MMTIFEQFAVIETFLENALFICLSDQMKHEPRRSRSKICLIETGLLQQNLLLTVQIIFILY